MRVYKILGTLAAVAAIMVLSGAASAKDISADQDVAQIAQISQTTTTTANAMTADDSAGYTYALFMDSQVNEFMMALTRQAVIHDGAGNFTNPGAQEVSSFSAGNSSGNGNALATSTIAGTSTSPPPAAFGHYLL